MEKSDRATQSLYSLPISPIHGARQGLSTTQINLEQLCGVRNKRQQQHFACFPFQNDVFQCMLGPRLMSMR